MAHVLAKDLREAVLQAAITGGLSEHLYTDSSVKELLDSIAIEKTNLFKGKKDKYLTPINTDEYPFDIPEEWSFAKLGYISTYATSKNKINAKNANPDLWMLDLEDIEKGGRVLNKKRVSDSKAIGDKTCFDSGDILYSKLRPYLQKILIVDEKGVCTPELIPFKLYGEINPNYILLFLKSPYVDTEINKVTYGVKMPRVGTETMVNLYVPIPPIEEQARIVTKVDEIMAKIDEYEKLENQLVKLKEQFPQDMKESLLQAGMMGKLTEQLESDTIVDETSSFNTLNEQRFDIPKVWTWFNLKDLMSICTGKKDQNFATRDGAYNFYTCAKEVFKAPNYSFEGESLILPGNGANVGTVTLYNGKFEAYQRTYVLQSINKTINMKFMYYCLLENWNRYNKNKMFGSAIPYIKLGNLQNYPVALPPIEEQQRIVDKLDELLPLVEHLSSMN